MWSMAAGVSWQAEQAEAIGDFTSVVSCAWHGASRVHFATVPVHFVAGAGAAGSVTHVQGVSTEHVVEPCLNVTETPWTVTGPLTVIEQGLAAVQTQGAAGVQAVAPCVPL